MPLIVRIYRKYFSLILVSVLALFVGLAWWNRFVQDDAFISFRYAENLARGLGLTWNPPERIEGYSNFLWTLVMSAVIRLGGDPVTWSVILGLACFTGSLILTYRIARLLFDSADIAILSVILLGAHFTFSAYATGGLETPAVTLVLLAMVCRVVSWTKTGTMSAAGIFGFSLLMAASLLLRMDSAVFCLVLLPAAAMIIYQQTPPAGSTAGRLLLLVAPCALLIGAWLIWKLSYYGSILPNTFYLKVGTARSVERGFTFLHRYMSSYLLYPLIILGLFASWTFLKTAGNSFLVLLALVAAWTAYTIFVGGDFMEFRILVPMIPLLTILFAWLVFRYFTSPILRAGIVAFLVFGLVHHITSFEYSTSDGIEPVKQLSGHVRNADEDWAGIGKVLGRAFGDDSTITIATTAAGAIPFYSQLKTVDMLGLNDRTVATSGYYFGRAPGHERIATLDYLLERKVNLVISHPYVTLLEDEELRIPLIPGFSLQNLKPCSLLEIPIDGAHKVIVLYLTPHPAVDRAIAEHGWKMHVLSGQQRKSPLVEGGDSNPQNIAAARRQRPL